MVEHIQKQNLRVLYGVLGIHTNNNPNNRKTSKKAVLNYNESKNRTSGIQLFWKPPDSQHFAQFNVTVGGWQKTISFSFFFLHATLR